ISGGRAAVGAPLADYTAGTPVSDTGAVYMFAESSGSWSQTYKVHASDRAEGDGFAAVSLEGQRLVVGAMGDELNAGAAYVFEYSGTSVLPTYWDEKEKLTATGGGAGDNFGKAVSLDGHRLLVAAHLADAGSTNDAGA